MNLEEKDFEVGVRESHVYTRKMLVFNFPKHALRTFMHEHLSGSCQSKKVGGFQALAKNLTGTARFTQEK